MNSYKILGWLAMLLTPIGAVIFFGWRVYTAVLSETNHGWLAVPAGVAAAVGLEMIGIFAGHLAMDLWQRKDGRAWLAAAIMVVYVAIGVIELAGTIGMVMFIIAPLVYVLVGLRQTVDGLASEETAVSHAKLDFQIEQARLDKEAERQRKAKEIENKTAVSLARIEAKSAARTRQVARQDGGNLPADWRQLTTEQKYKLAHATRENRNNMLPPLANRTRREWHKRLDEVAARNGDYILK